LRRLAANAPNRTKMHNERAATREPFRFADGVMRLRLQSLKAISHHRNVKRREELVGPASLARFTSWNHSQRSSLGLQLIAQLVQHKLRTMLTLFRRIMTVKEGALLGVDQLRAGARGLEFHGCHGDRYPRLILVQDVGVDDAPIWHDLLIACVEGIDWRDF
jgi:hypothetical protein